MNNTTGPTVFSAPLSAIPVNAYLVIGLIALALVAVLMLAGRKKERVEDPARLTTFLAKVNSLDWTSAQATQSLNTLFEGVTELVKAEILYYYRSRVARRRVAVATRFGAFVFGSLGLLCPLLATAIPAWAGLAGLGYLLFAAAAACFTANELFGGTRGHARAVATQYRLESLLNRFVVDWHAWHSAHEAARVQSTLHPMEGAFVLLRTLLERTYALLDQETGEWSAAVAAAETSYRANVNNQTAPRTGDADKSADANPPGQAGK